jgi:hypothetical protein
MLSSPVFARLQSRSSVLTLSGSAKPQQRPNPPAAPRASTPTTGQTVCELVTLRTPTDSCIPFLFNHPSSLRLRRRPTECSISRLISCSCGRFSCQQGGTPTPSIFLDCLSIRSPLFPVVHPFSLQSLTICSSRNSFVLTTIHFHGGCIPLYPERPRRRAPRLPRAFSAKVYPERPRRRAPSSSSAYLRLLFAEITQILEIRASWGVWFSSPRFHGS